MGWSLGITCDFTVQNSPQDGWDFNYGVLRLVPGGRLSSTSMFFAQQNRRSKLQLQDHNRDTHVEDHNAW